MINIKGVTTKELVNFYNKHTDKPVVKFRDRATAEKRCLELATEEGVVVVTKSEAAEIIAKPKDIIKAAKEGTKIAKVIDALWEGATEIQILSILGVTRTTKANTAKFNHWLRWNVNKDKGYGIARKTENSVDIYYIIAKNDGKRIPHITRGQYCED